MIIEIAQRRRPRAEETIMGDFLQPTHLLVIAILLFVLFGAKRLPELGKGLGEGLKGFKEGLKGVSDPAPPAPPTPNVQQNVTPPQPPSTPIEPK
jgi:sec-independent protein translocase protein TatA